MAALPVCLNCYEVFDPRMIDVQEEHNLCPRLTCGGDLIWVDENMIPIIFELNRKGYFTTNSCSGHIWDIAKIDSLRKYGADASDEPMNNLYHSIYIMFDTNVLPPTVPSGFTIEVDEELEEENDFICIIRRKNDSEEESKQHTHLTAQQFIFSTLNALLEWAVSLPPRKLRSPNIPEQEVETLNSEEDIQNFMKRRKEKMEEVKKEEQIQEGLSDEARESLLVLMNTKESSDNFYFLKFS